VTECVGIFSTFSAVLVINVSAKLNPSFVGEYSFV
jgi:hypothetical protein